MSRMNEVAVTINQQPQKVKDGQEHLSEHGAIINQNQVQHLSQIIDKYTRVTKGLCSICGQPIPAERLERYPNVTRCVPCQSIVEKPETLRTEIARFRHTLALMQKQYDAAERLELVSSEKRTAWQEEIRRYQERLVRLQAAFHGEGS